MYTYMLQNSLYINLTNQCTNNCVFCVRKNPEGLGVHLWLDREPSAEDVIGEIPKPEQYDEIIFCGYGEPTLRLPQLLQVSKYLKEHGTKTRLNTNGHGSLYWGRNIVPELASTMDCVSISLNAMDVESYNKLCQPENMEESYTGVLEFIKECTRCIPEVWISVVDVISAYEIQKCREIATALGVNFRVRHYY